MIAPATDLKTIRCAVYTRKSVTEGLDQEFNSLDAQREACEAYITSQKHEGWICLPEDYDDGGFTGGNLDRPALSRLKEDIKAGEVDCVVVYKVDRLSRSLLDFSRLVEVFDKHSVSFVSVTQPINTADSTGRLMLNILLSFAQFEREQIADRTRDKVCAARRRGKWTGGIPVLGYDIHPTDKKLLPNEQEAHIVRAIFDLYLKHRSLQKVAAEMDRRGWTTKEWTTKKGKHHPGQKFSKSTLARHLTNPVYIGFVLLNGKRYPGEHRGIIRKEVFDKAQAILKDNRQNNGSKVKNRYGALLKGLVRCGACGTAMVPTTARKNNRIYRYYTCSSAQKLGWKTCPHPSVKAQDLEAMVIGRIRVIGSDPALQAEVLKQATQAQREQKTTLTAEQGRLKARLAGIQGEMSGLLKVLGDGCETGTSITPKLQDLEAKAGKLQARLAEIDVHLTALNNSAIDRDHLVSALSLFDPMWEVLWPVERASVLELLVESVTYRGHSGDAPVSFNASGIGALGAQISSV